eukprot:scaffold7402_cov78-Cylindrotheca_fusiformis.AAC.1
MGGLGFGGMDHVILGGHEERCKRQRPSNSYTAEDDIEFVGGKVVQTLQQTLVSFRQQPEELTQLPLTNLVCSYSSAAVDDGNDSVA